MNQKLQRFKLILVSFFNKQIIYLYFDFQKNKDKKIIIKHIICLVLFFTTGISSFSQTTTYKKELYFSVEIAKVLKIIANNHNQSNNNISGILTDNHKAAVKVSVYDKEKYEALPIDDKSEAFLYGMTNNLATEYSYTGFQNEPFTLTPRGKWDCYWHDCGKPFTDRTGTVLYPSNDLRMYKKALVAKQKELQQFYYLDSNLLFYSPQFYETGSLREYCNVIVVIDISSNSLQYQADMSRIKAIRIPGIPEFNPNIANTIAIDVFRASKTIPVSSIILNNNYQNQLKELTVFEGDSLVFKSSQPQKISGLTDISIMRWAGESIYMTNQITDDKHKPFLFYDSNVHGIKLRTYPEEWNKPSFGSKAKYPSWEKENPLLSNEYKYYWIANTRRDVLKGKATDEELNSNVKLSPYKSKSDFIANIPNFPSNGFPNSNKFSGFSEHLDRQRNNQKEGLNYEVLKAFLNGKKGVAGLDPDEIIYPDFPTSDITNNLNKINGKVFNYVDGDFWKKIDNNHESINHTLKFTLTMLGKIYRNNDKSYKFHGDEILDQNLFIYKTGGEYIDGRFFENAIPQSMFNYKRPVYYNPSITNKPLFLIGPSISIQSVGTVASTTHLGISVLSPLEGKRYGVPYDQLTENMRKNPLVNFYGIISGPTYVARYKENVTYTVSNLPNLNDVPGYFQLVYTNEDSNGFLTKKSKLVHGGDPSFTISQFGGGGYHEITLYYYRTKDTSCTPVIIAGKELIDVDLRFIFSPNSTDGVDFSYNPTVVFGDNNDTVLNGKVRLAE
ncbi:MAG TPA: hypothetical protein DDZ41_03685, partial [Flavobacterium sp.]|nr:hypothetical protein [Flavobacterium sp.]